MGKADLQRVQTRGAVARLPLKPRGVQTRLRLIGGVKSVSTVADELNRLMKVFALIGRRDERFHLTAAVEAKAKKASKRSFRAGSVDRSAARLI